MITPNWKIVVLNTNFGYRSNFWVLLDPYDPNGELEYLIKECDEAEKNGQFVTILGEGTIEFVDLILIV